MNILLLNPRLRTWSPNVYVPLGLAYIAAVLEQVGHRVEIADLNVRKVSDADLRERVKSTDIVGITGMITEYGEVIRLANLVKKARPENISGTEKIGEAVEYLRYQRHYPGKKKLEGFQVTRCGNRLGHVVMNRERRDEEIFAELEKKLLVLIEMPGNRRRAARAF